jgi:hypothetical protein
MALFSHRERAEAKLVRKLMAWKRDLADSVAAAHQKLSTHYSKTYGPGREIHSRATILNRSEKLDLYNAPKFSADVLKKCDESFQREVLKNYTVPSQTEATADTTLMILTK